MALYNQFLKPSSTQTASKLYNSLVKEDISIEDAVSLLQDGTMCPIIHWNAIWHHRIAVELCARLYENPDLIEENRECLENYRAMYNRMFSTLPLKSNKSFSYYLGAIALDAALVVKKDRSKNINRFFSIVEKLVGDGCFIEGSHYSIFCSQSFDKVYNLLQSYYGPTPVWLKVCKLMESLQKWQRRISNNAGVVASIGDSWYEVVNPDKETGTFLYKDMTICKNKNWVVIKCRRRTGWALHEHPHLDEVLVSKDNQWVVQGSGMPSYSEVMSNPLRWRRPYNHFSLGGRIFNLPFIWRLYKPYIASRSVSLGAHYVTIHEQRNKKTTVRWPLGDRLYPIENRPEKNIVDFCYKGAHFSVSGDIQEVTYDYSWQSTTYGKSEKVRVICITGIGIKTKIE